MPWTIDIDFPPKKIRSLYPRQAIQLLICATGPFASQPTFVIPAMQYVASNVPRFLEKVLLEGEPGSGVTGLYVQDARQYLNRASAYVSSAPSGSPDEHYARAAIASVQAGLKMRARSATNAVDHPITACAFENLVAWGIGGSLRALPDKESENLRAKLRSWLKRFNHEPAMEDPGIVKVPENFDFLQKMAFLKSAFERLSTQEKEKYFERFRVEPNDGLDYLKRVHELYIGDVAVRNQNELVVQQKRSICQAILSDYQQKVTKRGGGLPVEMARQEYIEYAGRLSSIKAFAAFDCHKKLQYMLRVSRNFVDVSLESASRLFLAAFVSYYI